MSTKNQVFQLRLDEITRAQLRVIAKQYGTSESEIIRIMIRLCYNNIKQ